MSSAVMVGRDAAELERGHAPATVRVALAGCGAVGSALVRELAARRESLARRYGIVVELVAVLVRDPSRPRDAVIAPEVLGSDLAAFLASDADVVIEAIGGIEPARHIVESALRRGATVVTANKTLLAAHGSALTELARRHGAVLRHDAAVGGGVPVLRLIDDALGAGTPTCVRGILNGTTNFVLTRLAEGDSLEQALATARGRGFAEADALRDLDGRDAADKLALVAWAAYGVAPESVCVRRASLLPDPARYVALAGRLGGTVRQLAECALVNGAVVASVEPVIVAAEGPLARTRDEQNRIDVHTGWSAPLGASGPGAGGLPTATALLSDLLCTSDGAPRGVSGRCCAADTRRFSWAVEVRGSPALLHRHVPRCGPVGTTALADASWTIVDRASPETIERVLDALRSAGGDPIAARLDDESEAVHAAGWVA